MALLDGVRRILAQGSARLWMGRHRAAVIRLRTQRDTERIKLGAVTVIAPDRAVTLLATGARVLVDPRDRGCGATLMHEGRHEEPELRLFRSLLTPDSVVLDVGANYGYYSLCVAPFVRPGGRVIAFEPNPHIHSLLQASLQLNGFDEVVDARCIGVSDVADHVHFVIDEMGPGGAHIFNPRYPPPDDWLHTEVPVAPLDEALADLDAVDLVKIDVEGHEERVLRGMARLIARSPNIRVFMEFIYAFLADEAAFDRLLRLVTDELGLRVYRLANDGTTAEVDRDALQGASCTLVLSRTPLEPRPDITVHARHLELAAGATLAGDVLTWRRAAAVPSRQTLCFGGDLYLPRGTYRVDVDGAFDGPFLLRLVSQGEIVWEARTASARFSARVALPVDAPRLEVVIIATGPRSRSAHFRSAAFWRL